MDSIKLDGVTVYFTTLSPKSDSISPITIICLHNAGTDHTIWSPVAEILSEKYKVVLLDWPGYGEKRSTLKNHSLDTYAEILGGFMKEAQIGPAVIVGNCLGSGAALAYCLRTKNVNIHALALFNVLLPRTLGQLGEAFFRWSGSRFKGLFHRVRESLFVPGILTGSVVNFQMKDPKKVPREMRKHLEKLNRDPANIRNLGLLVDGLHQAGDLDGMRKPAQFPPTMFIWGSENRVLPLEKGLAFAHHFGPTEFHKVNGGHLVMLEQPADCAKRILAFIEKSSALGH